MSVIVCTRDRPQWLARAVRSVLAQEADDLEVLIVDDASVSPPELPADPRGRIRLLRLDSHRGPGAARAAGLRAAEGELIAYCDDDDEWHPGHLRILVEYLRQHPEVDLVYGDSEWRQVGVAPTVAYSFDYDLPALTGENYIFASDVLHRAAAARVAGGFDETLPAYEDWDLWLRMSQSGTFRHVPAVVGTHHWHEDAVSAGDCWQVRDQVYELHQADTITLIDVRILLFFVLCFLVFDKKADALRIHSDVQRRVLPR